MQKARDLLDSDKPVYGSNYEYISGEPAERTRLNDNVDSRRELLDQQGDRQHDHHHHTHEHGGAYNEHNHQHQHDHHHHTHEHGGAYNEHNYHEKHIMHDRKHYDAGDQKFYREGVDPTMNRDIATEYHHDGGKIRQSVKEAPILKETVKQVEMHKVQPVVHRDREQKEIRHIVEPRQEVAIADTKIHHRERDIDLGVRREASTLDTSRSVGNAPNMENSREFLGSEKQHQDLPARVEEHVHRKVEEHVHPVVYKDVLKPTIVEETHHLYEKVKETPIETYEYRGGERDLDNHHQLHIAERQFFDHETGRGLTNTQSHQYEQTQYSQVHRSSPRPIHHMQHSHNRGILSGIGTHTHDYNHDPSHMHHHHQHKHEHTHEKNIHVSAPLRTTVASHVHEPLMGHHQNIGAHHVPAAVVQGGHNSAYDAALCNQCTNNPICSHSVRDADRMQKMNEKKIAQDDKLAHTQAKKSHNNSQNVSVV